MKDAPSTMRSPCRCEYMFSPRGMSATHHDARRQGEASPRCSAGRSVPFEHHAMLVLCRRAGADRGAGRPMARNVEKIAFIHSEAPEAIAAAEELSSLYGQCAPEEADVIVVLGGDGIMLQTL